MWFRGQYVPILSGRSRKDVFGSEDWAARGTVQRIGAAIFSIVLFCGSVGLFVASPFVRVQTVQDMGGILGQVFGTVLLVLSVLVASGIMFVALRLAQGVVRSFRQ
jgi:hypothetical protein